MAIGDIGIGSTVEINRHACERVTLGDVVGNFSCVIGKVARIRR